jgi:hypothetical protein
VSLSQGGALLSCPGPVDLCVLLPHLAGVVVEEVTAAASPRVAGVDDFATQVADRPAGKYAERTRRHELVHQLRAEGRGLREIARHLGWGLHTVQRLDRAATWQELADGRWQGPRPSNSTRSSPTSTSTTTAPTRPASHFPGSPVIGRHASAAKSAGCRAGEGLPGSRRHYRHVPSLIRRGDLRGCASRLSLLKARLLL